MYNVFIDHSKVEYFRTSLSVMPTPEFGYGCVIIGINSDASAEVEGCANIPIASLHCSFSSEAYLCLPISTYIAVSTPCLYALIGRTLHHVVLAKVAKVVHALCCCHLYIQLVPSRLRPLSFLPHHTIRVDPTPQESQDFL